jgi:hypothetical protein
LTEQAQGKPDDGGAWRARLGRLMGDKRSEIVVLVMLLVLFTVCAAFFAFRLKSELIPDEPSHFYVSTLFSTTWGFPEVTERALTLGHRQFDRFPFLYYWLNGRALALIGLFFPRLTEVQNLHFLRFINVIYSVLNLVFVYFLAEEVLRKRWWPLLVVFFASSTLMFTFLSGGVSYDNLANLCSTGSIYYLIRTLRGKNFITNSLAWIIFIGMGILVKKTILPLALFQFICWVFFIIVNLIVNWKRMNLVVGVNWKLFLTTALATTIIGLNISLYGVNLIEYDSVFPKCKELHTATQCDLSVFKQRASEMGIQKGKIKFSDVYEQNRGDPVNYLLEYWFDSMRDGVFGIKGHQIFLPVNLDSYYSLFFFIIFLISLRYRGIGDGVLYALLLLVVLYFGTIFYINYTSELKSDFRHIAIQGRYLFPILAPFYVLVVEFISQVRQKVVRGVVLAYSLVLFILGGPAYFLLVVAARNNLNWFV